MRALSRRGWARSWSSEAGSGTVLTLVVLALVSFLATVALARGQQVLAIRQASSAADLAALAGAQALRDPCGRAGSVAAANGAWLSGCSAQGGDVQVQVSLPMPSLPARLLQSFRLPTPPVTAQARAGYPSSS